MLSEPLPTPLAAAVYRQHREAGRCMVPSKRYKVFYTFLRGDYNVPSDAPVEMSLEDVCSKLFPKLNDHDDFLGLVDEHDNCFQIRIYGGYLLDVPIPERAGSLELTVEKDEALKRLAGIPRTITPAAFSDFEFRPWPVPDTKPWWRFW